jgi:type VI protein secretion system component Hcp
MDEMKKQPEEIQQPAESTSPELSEAALKEVAGGETSPNLFGACSTGKHIIKGQITL